MGVNPNLSRRTFLTWYMAGLMTATLVAGIAPILVFIWPPPAKGQKNGEVAVKLDKAISSLQDGEAVRFDAPQNAGFIMKDGGGDNAAGDIAYSGYVVKTGSKTVVLAVNCSHLGCSVNYNSDKKAFECPCHGSRFAPDGKVIHGPATSPLSHLDAKASTGQDLQIRGFSSGGA